MIRRHSQKGSGILSNLDYSHILPADIELASMAIIERELQEKGIGLDPQNAPVIKRVIHTTADFDFASTLHFTPDAVKLGVQALKQGASIVTDTNMAKAGISRPSLMKLGSEVYCFMAEKGIAAQAKARGSTRAVVAMEYAAQQHPNALFAVGNAPTALLSLANLIQEGMRPTLVVGVPVGFVNVEESKRRALSVCQSFKVPAIISMGRKGGSTVAAAICNALLYMASNTLDPAKRW